MMNELCVMCAERPAVPVARIRENIGKLVARRHVTYAGRFCPSCLHRCYARATARTFFLGWWGLVSLLVTPIFLIANALCYRRALREVGGTPADAGQVAAI